MRKRQMTAADRLELGLFITLLTVGLIALTYVMHLTSLPRMAAWSQAAGRDKLSATGTRATRVPQNPGSEQAANAGLLAPQTPSLPGWNSQLAPMQLPSATALAQSAQEAALGRDYNPAPQRRVSAPMKPVIADIRTYHGDKYRLSKTIKLRVTAYAPDPRCTYPFPGTTTASGMSVKTNGGKLVAADTSLVPMHALVVVPGYAKDAAVPVLDRGGAIKGARLDILLPTFSQAQTWGSKTLEVKVYEPMK